MEAQLQNFMREGLRVLCFASRTLTQVEVALLMANKHFDNDDLLQEKLEQNLTFLGFAGLED